MSSNAANEQVICKNGKVAFQLISFIIEIGGGGYVEKIVVEQFWKGKKILYSTQQRFWSITDKKSQYIMWMIVGLTSEKSKEIEKYQFQAQNDLILTIFEAERVWKKQKFQLQLY